MSFSTEYGISWSNFTIQSIVTIKFIDCDYGWNIKVGTTFALFGGTCSFRDSDGVLCCYLFTNIGNAYWLIGAKREDCDYGWNIKEGTAIALFGDYCGDYSKVGIVSCALSVEYDFSILSIGANYPMRE